MKLASLIPQIAVGLCLLLLPMVVFRRVWTFRIGITKREHRVTKLLLAIWATAGCLAAALLCGVPVLQAIRENKARELAAAGKRLERSNLSLEVRAAQAEADRAKLLGGGTHYLFDGSTITTRPYKGRETVVFERMVKLKETGDWSELAAVAERQIPRTPQWLTPYLFLGQACLRMGNTEKALANLRHVTDKAPLDPEYRLAYDLLAQIPPSTKP